MRRLLRVRRAWRVARLDLAIWACRTFDLDTAHVRRALDAVKRLDP